MKKLYFLLLLLGLFSCEEIGPEINPGGGISTPDAERTARVLVEEFTGVRCVNCPAGSLELQALAKTYGEQLVLVSIHAGSFAPPYKESKEDFRTAKGSSLMSNYLGTPFGYPSAIVNRKLFPDERDLQLGKSLWPIGIQTEAARELQADLELDISYNASNRNGTATVDVNLLTDLSGRTLHLTLMVAEDNIADAQLTPDGQQLDYLHRHALREIVSNFDGTPLTGTFSSGAQLSQQYNFTIDQKWIADNCSLIAVLHFSDSEKTVIQVIEKSLL